MMDGVKEVDPREYHWYVARASAYGRSGLAVVIPAAIVRHLGLRRGDVVEVAIRRADEEAIREHGGVYGRGPRRVGRGRAPQWRRVRCPRCGEEGTVSVYRGYVHVRHGRSGKCYVCPADTVEVRAPELKEVVERLLRSRNACEGSSALNGRSEASGGS